MHAMIIRRDENPFQRADVHREVRVLPELNQHADAIAEAGLQRTEVEDEHRHGRLRDVVDERVQKTGAETRKPVEVLDGMMPGVRAPEESVRCCARWIQ